MNVSMNGRDRRAWVEVDTAALIDNARTVARVAGTRLLPIVKADAYGLGAVAVSRALEATDPWGYGVATIDEGAELRHAGVTRPVLVLGPARPDVFEQVRRFQLTPVLEDAESVRRWTAESSEQPFHVEIDTGMGRTGVRWDAVAELAPALDTPAFEGCFTQLHSADRGDHTAEYQRERFLAAVAMLPRRPKLLHVANSAAALQGSRFALDLVRPGVFLYGGRPGPRGPEPKPVASLRARVVSVRRLAAGDGVSYGATWTAPRATTVATLGIGYADGLRRSVGGSGMAHILLGGRAYPIVGQVTMDLTMADVGDAPVRIGDVATLIGTDGSRAISLQDFAGWACTIPYEVLTGLGRRLPRIHL